MPHKKCDGERSCPTRHGGAAAKGMGPSAKVRATGNSNPECGLFGAPPKGVK